MREEAFELLLAAIVALLFVAGDWCAAHAGGYTVKTAAHTIRDMSVKVSR